MRRYSSLYLKAEILCRYMALAFVFLKTVIHIKLIVFLHTFTTMMIIIRSLAFKEALNQQSDITSQLSS